MAVYDLSKLYWLKLYDDFYKQDTIEWLMGQENGTVYIVLYQILLLKTLNKEGELSKIIGGETLSYTYKDISKLTGIKENLVEQGIEKLKKIGLLEIDFNNIIYLPYLKYMVGETSKGALKKSVQRSKQTNVHQR